MNKPTQALTFPSDPMGIKAMQDLDKEHTNTRMSKELSNASNDGVITQSIDEPIIQASESAITPTSKAPKPQSSKQASNPVKQQPSEALMAQLTGQSNNEPIIRLNVEVTETLHQRIKQYCVMHKVKSIKVLVTAVLDDFLKQQGY